MDRLLVRLQQVRPAHPHGRLAVRCGAVGHASSGTMFILLLAGEARPSRNIAQQTMCPARQRRRSPLPLACSHPPTCRAGVPTNYGACDYAPFMPGESYIIGTLTKLAPMVSWQREGFPAIEKLRGALIGKRASVYARPARGARLRGSASGLPAGLRSHSMHCLLLTEHTDAASPPTTRQPPDAQAWEATSCRSAWGCSRAAAAAPPPSSAFRPWRRLPRCSWAPSR